MSRDLRDAEAAERWLATGLCLTRLSRPTAERLRPAVRWVLAAVAESPALPPAGVVLDVGGLLAGEPLESNHALTPADVELRQAIQQYEEQLLGRLAADTRFEAAVDAFAKLDTELRPAAVAVIIDHLLDRLDYGARTSVNPAAARRALQRPPGELLEAGLAGVREAGSAAAASLARSYRELARRARHAHRLLNDRDIFVLENLDVLGSRGQRLAIEQIVDAAEQLTRALPNRVRKPAPRGPTPTTLEDESNYPTGGFSAISNAGSIENLVSSELVYIDDGPEIDLFDVRYAEGELLFYARDDNVLVRRNRVFEFVLHPDLVGARFKDADLPWQRLVIGLGLVNCLVRRLIGWLDEQGLTFRLTFVEQGRDTPLTSERALCRLLFGEWIERGLLTVETAAETELIGERAVEQTRAAAVDIVSISCGARFEHLRAKHLRQLDLDLSAPHPKLLRSGRADDGATERDPWQAWADMARTMIHALL